jgi:DNA adenine methylase
MPFLSPLRYPGGKKSLKDYLAKLLITNPSITKIVEPYAGGFGLSLDLLSNSYIKEAYLNDADENIYLFWRAVLYETDLFISRLENIQINMEEWNRQRSILFDPKIRKEKSEFDIGFAAFFLNRCNHSGIIRKEIGPIGGKAQEGDWRLDARFNKENLIYRIKSVAAYRDCIHVTGKDAISFLNTTGDGFTNNETLIYLDPPYYEKGSKLYRLYFDDVAHKRLFEYLSLHKNLKWVLSYDDSEFIDSLYSEFFYTDRIAYDHHANRHNKKYELIIMSNSLKREKS